MGLTFPLFLVFLFLSIGIPVSKSSTVPSGWPVIPVNLQPLNCTNYDSVTGFCEMQTAITNGFYWNEPDGTIEFTGVVANLRGQEDCTIIIQARNVWFEHSNITACDIIIIASLSIKMDSSVLSVDGAQTLGPGYVDDITIGNSFGGAGGFCGDGISPDNTYGDFTTNYTDDEYTFGTGGSDELSQGGGRIVVITQELSALGSALTADGFPKYCTETDLPLKGGTGGYIYIEAQSTFVSYEQNYVSAQGGAACSNTSLAGSGGRVVVSADPGIGNRFNISVRGGESFAAQPCATGGFGTIFCHNYSETIPNILFVGQTCQVGMSNFTVAAPTYVDLTSRENLTIAAGPTVTIAVKPPQTTDANIVLESINLYGGSRMVYYSGQGLDEADQAGPPLTMTIVDTLEITGSEIWADCNITLNVQGSLTLRDSAFITSGAQNATIIINTIYLSLENSSILFSATSPLQQLQQQGVYQDDSSCYSDGSDLSDLEFEPTEAIAANFFQPAFLPFTAIIIQANLTEINLGDIQAAFVFISATQLNHIGIIGANYLTCNDSTIPVRSTPVLPFLYDLNIAQMMSTYNSQDLSDFIWNVVFQDYTVFILSQSELNVLTGTIQGSRIGLFSNQTIISQNATINASGWGCPADQGPGSGVAGEALGGGCASTGGAYGSVGGIGYNIEAVANTPQCIEQLPSIPTVYGDPTNPLYEGSGGGSFNGSLGGAGGGVIIIGATNSLEIEGAINASGTSPQQSITGENGAGAGAGGSIQLFMVSLFGNGSINADGGSVSANSWGGVGSGGRIGLNFLNWTQQTAQSSSDIPTVSSSSGTRYASALPSEVQLPNIMFNGNGSIYSTPCPPGYSGLFCMPCGNGFYKDDFSAGDCRPCVIPKDGVLADTEAQQSYMCPFTCEYKVWYNGYPYCASNMIAYAFYTGSMYAGILAGLCALALVMYFISYTVFRDKSHKTTKPIYSISSDREMTGNRQKGQYFTNSHVLRINILGDNTPESKWFISNDITNLKEIEQIRDKIDHLNKSINRATNWKKSWAYMLKALILLYSVLYFCLLQKFREKLFKKIKTLVKETNQELKEYCVIRGIPIYYITITVDNTISSGYLDLFQNEGGHSDRNTLLPISLTLLGNGKYCSPYYIDKEDPMLEHLAGDWALKNCSLSEKSVALFRYDFRKFISKFNKTIKYLDYYSFFKTFLHCLAEVTEEVNAYKETFSNEYGIFLSLFAFEVPRYTVKDTRSTRPFLQSPVRVTLLEDTKNPEFHDTVDRLQRAKIEEDYDVKLFIIVHSGRDLQSLTQKLNEARSASAFPFLTEKMETSKNSKPKDLNTLKQDFYKKLDELSFSIEYSIPRQIGLANSDKQKISPAKKRGYATSRRYFKAFHEVFHAMIGFRRSTKKVAEIYVSFGALILLHFFLLWIRAVSIIELGIVSAEWVIWFPFPLAPILSLFFGLLGAVSRERKVTVHYGLLNASCIVNQILSLVIISATVNYSLPGYIFELVTFILFVLNQVVVKYLLAVQS